MKTTIKIAMAAALLAGASSMAMAQMNGPSDTAGNAAASGGPGTHQVGGPKTGTASNMQKNLKNQNGYQGRQ